MKGCFQRIRSAFAAMPRWGRGFTGTGRATPSLRPSGRRSHAYAGRARGIGLGQPVRPSLIAAKRKTSSLEDVLSSANMADAVAPFKPERSPFAFARAQPARLVREITVPSHDHRRLYPASHPTSKNFHPGRYLEFIARDQRTRTRLGPPQSLQPLPTCPHHPRRSGCLIPILPKPSQRMRDPQPVIEMEVGPLDLRD